MPGTCLLLYYCALQPSLTFCLSSFCAFTVVAESTLSPEELHLQRLRADIDAAASHLTQCRKETKDIMLQMSQTMAAIVSATSPRTTNGTMPPVMNRGEMRSAMETVKSREAAAEQALRKAQNILQAALQKSLQPGAVAASMGTADRVKSNAKAVGKSAASNRRRV
jgi:hypothetical protein